MSSKIDDGGPAFARAGSMSYDINGVPNGGDVPEPGMTLRDYFAAQAMQGMCINPAYDDVTWPATAEAAYAAADAMLAERKRTSKEDG